MFSLTGIRDGLTPRRAAFAFVLLALAYAIQLASPLRMFNDSIAYVAMAESAVAGNGFLIAGESMRWPSGYSRILAQMLAQGFFGEASVVTLNLCFLALGLWGCYGVLTRLYDLRPAAARSVCLACLLSYGFARYAGAVLSDMVYFGLSSASLALLALGERSVDTQRRARWAALAIPLALASIAVRTIGIVLLPAIVWAVFGSRLMTVWRNLKLTGATLAVGAAAAASVAVAAWMATETSYVQLAASRYQAWSGAPSGYGVYFITTRRLWEQGRLWLNLPEDLYPPDGTFGIFAVVGALAVLVLARGAWERRSRVRSVDLYIAGTVAVQAFYPFYLERHWLPVFPFLVVIAVAGVRSLLPAPWFGRVFTAYLVWFVCTGVAALALTARLSLSGEDFPRLFRPNRETYQFAFGPPGMPRPSTAKPMLLDQLRRHEPLASPYRSNPAPEIR